MTTVDRTLMRGLEHRMAVDPHHSHRQGSSVLPSAALIKLLGVLSTKSHRERQRSHRSVFFSSPQTNPSFACL
jgi:hypothetical protein